MQNKPLDLSYWEKQTWFSNVDVTIIGSGIVGLSCALAIKEKHPNYKVLVLEKGTLPQGASTKNAGFACFGSLSEILDDLETHSEEEVLSLIEKRWKGLLQLKETLGDTALHYKAWGGYELFTKEDTALFDLCADKMSSINKLLKPIFKTDVFRFTENIFNYNNILKNYVFNPFEGQINTGEMMAALLQKAQTAGVKIVNNISVEEITQKDAGVEICANRLHFSSRKVCIATNGFAKKLVQEDVVPARAQVLITKPIENLNIKGTFHLDKGYYYFRNIDNRILFGGGRNLDFKGEETSTLGTSAIIQDSLERILKETILPNTPFEIDHRWSGVMGVGKQKKAIVKALDNDIYCGVRMGGMGVAIGSTIGRELATFID